MSKLGESIVRACAAAASQRPWFVLLVALVLTGAAAYAATGLSVNTSTEEILSAELPFRQVDRAYRAAFPREELAVTVVDAPSPGEAEDAAAALVERLQGHPNAFSRVELAGSSPYFDRYGLMFLDAERIRALGPQLTEARPVLVDLSLDPSLRGLAGLLGSGAAAGEAARLAELVGKLADTTEQRAEGRPAETDWQSLFALGEDTRGSRRLVLAKPILDNTSLDRAGPALEELGRGIAAVRAARPDVTMRVTGDPVLRQQELNDAFSGAIYASGFSFVLVALSLIVGIRSGRLIAALLITLIVGSIWTTGLAAVTVGRLNLISVAFLVLFFGLGVDFGTHLGLRHLEETRRGAPFGEALRRSMLGEGPSIFLSALCAALAFLAFVPTSYVGLAEFGIISALGMVVAVIVTFTVQPALMALMPPKIGRRTDVTIGIGHWIKRHYRAIIGVAAVVTVAAVAAAFNAQLDANPLNLQDQQTEPVETYRDLARDPGTSPYALNVLAADADAARQLAPKLAAVAGVEGVRWIEDFVPADQPAKLAALETIRTDLGAGFFQDLSPDPSPPGPELQQAFADLQAAAAEFAASPDAQLGEAGRQFSAALVAFAEKRGTEPPALEELGAALAGQVPVLVKDLQEKLSVSEPVSVEDIPPELRRDWIGANGQMRLSVLPADDVSSAEAMRAFAARVKAVAPQAAGVPATVAGAGDAIVASFTEAILYTALAIAVVVAFVRRRVSDVLLVLTPLAVAALWTVAASVVLDLPFNFANIIVVPLLIGLGVASSIHIVVRAHEVVHDQSGDHEEGTEVLETSTPLAILVAQLNTVAAFATLAVSKHQGLYSMGLLLGTAIMLVLIVSLVVLPAFMIALDRRRRLDRAPGEVPA